MLSADQQSYYLHALGVTQWRSREKPMLSSFAFVDTNQTTRGFLCATIQDASPDSLEMRLLHNIAKAFGCTVVASDAPQDAPWTITLDTFSLSDMLAKPLLKAELLKKFPKDLRASP